jgi:hypothetical protein
MYMTLPPLQRQHEPKLLSMDKEGADRAKENEKKKNHLKPM